MWEKIIESGIITLVFGLVTSLSGIVIANNYSKNKEKREKKYFLTKEIYQKLVGIYNSQTKQNSVKGISKNSATDVLMGALMTKYQDTIKKFNDMRSSYLEIKYILSEKDERNLDSKFEHVEEINKTIFFTSLNSQLKKKKDYENITISAEVNMIEEDKIQEYMHKYIDETEKLEIYFLSIIVKELRQLLK